ncbi:MAG: beta-ketoacyl-[acyl-carrier-protein] synthase family protein [Planctomycetota bacterium]
MAVSSNERRVAVTGVGVASPLGLGAGDFWAALTAGTIAVTKNERFDASGFPCQLAATTPPFKVNQYVPKHYRKAAKVMARDIELAVVAADDAVRSAGLETSGVTDNPTINPERFGCNIGAGLINADLEELAVAMDTARSDADPNKLDLSKWGADGMTKLTPLWLLKYLPNMLACHVTIIHGLMGPSNTITCADASSHLAIGEAYRTIQRGDADVCICGGAESKVNPMGTTRHTLLGRLNAESNDDPANAVRPFAQDAKGSVHGEGGGLLILEELEAAKTRGATIYAEVVGFGASQDATGLVDADPEGRAYGNAVANALREAEAAPGDVDVIVPHGVGYAPADASELAGLRRAFSDDLGKPAFCPIKGQTGALAAGSGQDAATAVLALHHQTAPPAINCDRAGLNTSNDARPMDAKIALTSVASLGGQNAALVFRKA